MPHLGQAQRIGSLISCIPFPSGRIRSRHRHRTPTLSSGGGAASHRRRRGRDGGASVPEPAVRFFGAAAGLPFGRAQRLPAQVLGYS
jgi:hypothetical protein